MIGGLPDKDNGQYEVYDSLPKGSRKHNFAELVPGFGSDFVVPPEPDGNKYQALSRPIVMGANEDLPEMASIIDAIM